MEVFHQSGCKTITLVPCQGATAEAVHPLASALGCTSRGVSTVHPDRAQGNGNTV